MIVLYGIVWNCFFKKPYAKHLNSLLMKEPA